MAHRVIDNRHPNNDLVPLFNKIYKTDRFDKIFSDETVQETNVKFKRDGKDYIAFGTMTPDDRRQLDDYIALENQDELTKPRHSKQAEHCFFQGMKDFQLPQRQSAKRDFYSALRS